MLKASGLCAVFFAYACFTGKLINKISINTGERKMFLFLVHVLVLILIMFTLGFSCACAYFTIIMGEHHDQNRVITYIFFFCVFTPLEH